jgi:hypothetical protein
MARSVRVLQEYVPPRELKAQGALAVYPGDIVRETGKKTDDWIQVVLQVDGMQDIAGCIPSWVATQEVGDRRRREAPQSRSSGAKSSTCRPRKRSRSPATEARAAKSPPGLSAKSKQKPPQSRFSELKVPQSPTSQSETSESSEYSEVTRKPEVAASREGSDEESEEQFIGDVCIDNIVFASYVLTEGCAMHDFAGLLRKNTRSHCRRCLRRWRREERRLHGKPPL